jgi:small multidrug resistance pump
VQTIFLVLVFWAAQVFAVLAFKWGSESPDPEQAKRRWWMGFIGGNIVGVSSVWLLMLLFQVMNQNVAFGIGSGGAFLLGQLGVAIIWRSRLTRIQIGGLIAMTVGMLMLGMGGAL